MRCFVAIDLPEDVKEELKRLQSEIKKNSGSAGLKASFAKEFHITLKFLGEIAPQKAEAVRESLGSCRFKKTAAALDKIGVFPNESYIRVVWAGVSPEEGILEIQKSVDKALEKGFKKEKDFMAHITLARVKYAADRQKLLQSLKNIAVKNMKFSITEFKLKRSVLSGSAGPVYTDLAVYRQ